MRRATSGSAASSTSNSPSWAPSAWRRVEATPETRFAPELLCATRVRGRRISATIAADVVLPFVAETSTEPCSSRAASRSIAPGSSFQSSFPGSVVPPPRPATRESAPAARSTADSTTAGSEDARAANGSRGRSRGGRGASWRDCSHLRFLQFALPFLLVARKPYRAVTRIDPQSSRRVPGGDQAPLLPTSRSSRRCGPRRSGSAARRR